MESRLNRNLERKTKRKFLLTIFGTLVILVLVIKYGIPLLINFSLFMAGIKTNNQVQQTNGNQFVTPPILNTDLTATNSASVNIDGNAAAGESIVLYVNDTLVDQVNTKDDGSFTFNNVTLAQGQNTIKAKAKNGSSESNYSDSFVVTYKNNAPSLTIDQPSDGQSFSKDQNSVQVHGKTDPNIRVTVNGFWALTDDKGNYSYTIQFQNGDNKVDVIASDDAGNKTEKTITVHYSQ